MHDGLYSYKNDLDKELERLLKPNSDTFPEIEDLSKKVSVVMPIYCQAQYAKQAINSVLNQTYKNLELVIVNDGSTDNIEDVLKTIKDKRVKVINKKHSGIGDSLNLGFKNVTGDYETYLASDNIYYEDCLRVLVLVLNRYKNIGFAYTNFDYYYEDTKQLVPAIDTMKMDWNKTRFYSGYFIGIAYLWRKELRLKAGKFVNHPCEDYDMFLRMADLAEFKHRPYDSLAMYRFHNKAQTVRLGKEIDCWTKVCLDNAIKRNTKKPFYENYENKTSKEAEIFACV